VGQMTPTRNQLSRRWARTTPRPKLCDLRAVTGNDDVFTARYAIQDLSSTVSQFADCDLLHYFNVSPVRRHLKAQS